MYFVTKSLVHVSEGYTASSTHQDTGMAQKPNTGSSQDLCALRT